MSLNQVARDTGIDRGNLSRIERGLMSVSPKDAETLAKYFGYRVSEMQILYPHRFVEEAEAS